MTPNPTGRPSPVGYCHACGKPLYRSDNFVHNNQTGYAYCDAACQTTSEAKAAPLELAEADRLDNEAVARYRAFRSPELHEIVLDARRRADALARLELALEASAR